MYIIKEAYVYDKESAWEELARYNNSAGRLLKKEVIDYFKDYIPNKIDTVYRGMGFAPSDTVSLLKKFKIPEMKKGAKIKYQTGKIQSWTLDEKQAEEFMGLHVFGGILDSNSLGVLIKITNVKSDEIAVPIAYLPKDEVKKYLNFDQKEILLQPGTYVAEVVDFFGDWSIVDLNSELKTLAVGLQSQYGGTIKKTWNKAPGFSLDFDNIYVDKNWSPSIAVSLDTDNEVKIEIFSNIVKKDRKIQYKNSSKQDVVDLLKSKEFLKDFDEKFKALKSAYN